MNLIQNCMVILLCVCWVVYGLECYTCDSAEDAECATKPGQQINVEECDDSNDECVISISATGLTRRGCLMNLFPNKYCAEPCERCNTSLCNRHVFPANRLRCYQCSGAECINVFERPQLLLPCPIYNENDRCYTNIVHLDNTLRGCEHTNLPTDCPHVCLKCNYNGCNNELTVTEDRCIQCTHNRNTPNPLCLRNQEDSQSHVVGSQCSIKNGIMTDCSNKVMLGHRQNCFTYINEQTDVIQRGCSTSMGFYPTGKLSECYGEHCNNECIDIACNVCNSTDTLVNCRSGVNLSPQNCDSGTVACYSCEQDTLLRRGCVDANFVAGVGEVCQFCRSNDGCNRLSVRSCYHCNSLQNTDCTDWQDDSLIERTKCENDMELCVSTVVRRLDLVFTVRGCSGEVLECTPNDPYCVRCNGSLCNDLPTKWQKRKLQSLNTSDDAGNMMVVKDLD